MAAVDLVRVVDNALHVPLSLAYLKWGKVVNPKSQYVTNLTLGMCIIINMLYFKIYDAPKLSATSVQT